MRTSPAGLNLIKSFEGFSPRLYFCPAGRPTIGYGHVVRIGENFPEPMTEEDASALLVKDLEWAEEAVTAAVKAPLTEGRFDALVSLVFNIGAHAFRMSTLLKKLNARDYAGAAEEFGRWIKAGGKELPGLIRRRAAEAEMFRGVTL